jgi:hypothetical protein
MNYTIDISDVDAKDFSDDELHQQYSLMTQVTEYYKKLISELSPSEPVEHRKIATALLEQAERDLLIVSREMKERELEPRLPTQAKLVDVPQEQEEQQDEDTEDASQTPQEFITYTGPKVNVIKLPDEPHITLEAKEKLTPELES